MANQHLAISILNLFHRKETPLRSYYRNMNEFRIDRFTMMQILNEIKSLELHRYEDYVRIVGVVAILESAMQNAAQGGKAQEEVK